MEEDETPFKQIRNLLSVLFLGIIAAAAFAGFLLYYYGPTGVYTLKNVMVSPSLAEGLTYAEQNAATGTVSRYTFGKVAFSYWDETKKQWNSRLIVIDKYQEFYDSFGNLTSIAAPKEDVVSLFYRDLPSKLTLSVSTAGSSGEQQSKPFQEINFAKKGDYFRVELHQETASTTWAYFYQPNIYQETMRIFTGQGGDS